MILYNHGIHTSLVFTSHPTNREKRDILQQQNSSDKWGMGSNSIIRDCIPSGMKCKNAL